MIGQATCHSRCQVLFPLSAQFVMGPTEVVGTANKPHPSSKQLDGVGSVPPPTRHPGKPLTQRAIDPCNTGGIYNVAALRQSEKLEPSFFHTLRRPPTHV